MNKIITLSILLLSTGSFAQQSGRVNTGSIGFGLHWACPQSELQDIEYDDGLGINLSYLSRKMPYKSPINFQWGARMDFGRLGSREFENIIVVDGSTTLEGGASVTASNRMYGLFASGRVNFAPDGNKVTPYIDLLAGHRNYTTHQILELNKPGLHPEYESSDIVNRIVHTNRFHYGGSLGLNYQVSESFSLESSVTYTIGGTGAVLPLQDIVRAEGSNEIEYDNYQSVRTDLLLINVGIRLHLFKRYTAKNRGPNPTTTTPSTPQNTRYRDPNTPNDTTTPANTKRTRTTGGVRGTPGNTTTPTPVKKKVPKVKSDGPKKDPNGRG